LSCGHDFLRQYTIANIGRQARLKRHPELLIGGKYSAMVRAAGQVIPHSKALAKSKKWGLRLRPRSRLLADRLSKVIEESATLGQRLQIRENPQLSGLS
jgi:hypothetical protein